MLTERRNGNYAVIRYDKLIVNDSVYKYDDTTQSIVSIGARRRNTRPRVLPRGQASDVLHVTQQLDVRNHVSADVDPDQQRCVNRPIGNDTGLSDEASDSSNIE
jgi:hypothetical protein